MGLSATKLANPAAMSSAKQLVDSTLKGHRVVVFSKTYCPYCTKAKRALGSVLSKDKILVIELENMPNCDDIQSYLGQLTGGRSVPRVFVDGAFIGGGDDTDALVRSGKMEVMLKEKGIL